jgi:hypothetical protein
LPTILIRTDWLPREILPLATAESVLGRSIIKISVSTARRLGNNVVTTTSALNKIYVRPVNLATLS